jgi:hypothetical protein
MVIIGIADIQQTDLEAIVRNHVYQLRRLGGDGLLVQQHQETVQPLGCHGVGLRMQFYKYYFFCAFVGWIIGCVSMYRDLGGSESGASLGWCEGA